MYAILGRSIGEPGTLFAFELDVLATGTILGLIALIAHLALGRDRCRAKSAVWNACAVGWLLAPAIALVPAALAAPIRTQTEAIAGKVFRIFNARATNPNVKVRLNAEPKFAELERDPKAALKAVSKPIPSESALRLNEPKSSSVESKSSNPSVELASIEVDLKRDQPAPIVLGSIDKDNLKIEIRERDPILKTAISARSRPGFVLPYGSLFVWFHGVVASILLARLIGGIRGASGLGKNAVPLEDEAWLARFDRLRERIGITPRVRLTRSAEVDVPTVVGVRNPVVLVPDRLVSAATAEMIEAILIHEFAHIKRNDYLWNILLRFAIAAHWLNPFVWLARKLTETLREQACDDFCVFWLGSSEAYRATLLEVATGLARRRWETIGMAMTRTSKLARRLDSIEGSNGTESCVPGRLTKIVAACAVAVAIVLAGAFRAEPSRADGETKTSKNQQVTSRSDSSGAPQPGSNAEQKQADEPAAPVEKNQADEPAAADIKKPAEDPSEVRNLVDSAKSVAPLEVTVTRLRRHDVSGPYYLDCKLVASSPISIYAKVGGIVAFGTLVDSGKRVKKGELLAELTVDVDDRIEIAQRKYELAKLRLRKADSSAKAASAALQAKKAAIEEAESARMKAEGQKRSNEKMYEYLKKMNAKQAASQTSVDEANTKFLIASSELEAAKARVNFAKSSASEYESLEEGSRTDQMTAEIELVEAKSELANLRAMKDAGKIRSPIDGVVLKRNVHEGDRVDAEKGEPLFVVSSADHLTGTASMPQNYADQLDVGDPIDVNIYSPSKTIRTKVIRIDYAFDEKTRTIGFEFDVPNPDGRLRPGMTGSLTIFLNVYSNVLVVPSYCVFEEHELLDVNLHSRPVQHPKYVVVRVSDGKASLVRVGTQINELWSDDKFSCVRPDGDVLKEGDAIAVFPNVDINQSGLHVMDGDNILNLIRYVSPSDFPRMTGSIVMPKIENGTRVKIKEEIKNDEIKRRFFPSGNMN
jgi:beta-lactamase regulating signal transducer with metallopeptidase domain/multidrug resistance efflux pump